MSRDRFDELAALHSFGVLTPAETRELDGILRGDDALRTSLQEFHAAAAGIIDGLAPLPLPLDSLKLSIFEAVDGNTAPAAIRALRSAEGEWNAHPEIHGVEIKELARDKEANRVTFLMKLLPGAALPFHHHRGSEHCFVVAGEVMADDERFSAGDFLFAPAGTAHGNIRSAAGCTLLLTVSSQDYGIA